MNKYELLYIISADASEEAREGLIEKFKAYVEDRKGVVEGIDRWGMKKFAYPINFKNEGFYVLMNFSAEPRPSASIFFAVLTTVKPSGTVNLTRCTCPFDRTSTISLLDIPAVIS